VRPDKTGGVTLLYTTLGDSMSIDIYAGGPGRGATSLLHTNRDADFPDWAGRDLASRGYEVLDLTADGATTADVLEWQLPPLPSSADLVTLTGAVGDPGQPDPRPADRRLWHCGVIEPNAWGAHEIRCTWWRAIEQAGWLS
jgi:hypothetical protein